MAAAPEKGTILAGKYRVERVLGEGGMGIILLAQQLDLVRPVALKIPNAAALADADARSRFLREARAAAALESDHAVRVLDTGTLEDGSPYIAMERLEGVDLERLLRAVGPLPIATAASCVVEASKAIGEAHARGIVHRDIKPSNLFVARRFDGSERIVVLDFGLSKAMSTASGNLGLTGTSDAMGSPLYMSPERVRGAEHVDARADIWALGVVLYELLTGQPPFQSSSLTTLAALILEDEPRRTSEIRAEVPAELDAVVMRCLRKAAEERFASVTELVRELAPFAAPGPLDVLKLARTVSDETLPDSRAATELASFDDSPSAVAARNARTQTGAHPWLVPALGAAMVAALVLASIVLPSRSKTPIAPAPVVRGACAVKQRWLLSPQHTVHRPQIASALDDQALVLLWEHDGRHVVTDTTHLRLGQPAPELRNTTASEFGELPPATPQMSSATSLHGGLVQVFAVVVPDTRVKNAEVTRFLLRRLELDGGRGAPFGGRTIMHSSRDFAIASSASSVVIASLGASSATKKLELRIASIYGPAFDRALAIPEGVLHPEGLVRAFAASGSGRAFVGVRTPRSIHAFPVSATGEGEPEELGTGSPTQTAIATRGDEAIVAWRDQDAPHEIRYRRVREGETTFDPQAAVKLAGTVSSITLTAVGDRYLLIWTETRDGKRRSHYGFAREALEEALVDAAPIDIEGEVASASTTGNTVWLIYGGAFYGVTNLDCGR